MGAYVWGEILPIKNFIRSSEINERVSELAKRGPLYVIKSAGVLKVDNTLCILVEENEKIAWIYNEIKNILSKFSLPEKQYSFIQHYICEQDEGTIIVGELICITKK